MSPDHRPRKLLAGVAALAACSLIAFAGSAAQPPPWVASILFKGGETHLDLKDEDATPVTLPPVFAGWDCYIGDTQRVGDGFTKQVTCGGRWGFVDTFVSCDSKQRRAIGTLRLRQPINGTKAQVDAAEKVTIVVGCGYADKK